MTFDFTAAQAAARESARQFAREHLAPGASITDADATVPDDVHAPAAALVAATGDAVSLVVVVEALASASASAALAAATPAGRSPLDLAGLRGAPRPEENERGSLVVSAVALGVAQAALDRALADLRESAARTGDGDKPHWAVADAATELDAARLLTYRAATLPDSEAKVTAAAMARLLATAAAVRAVDVAIRLAGATGFAAHGALDRLARDAKALALLGGGEDAQRATVAVGILPG